MDNKQGIGIERRKKSKIAFFLIGSFALLSVVVVFIVVWTTSTPTIFTKKIFNANIHDCQGSRECFLESFRTCDRAKLNVVIHTVEGDPVYTFAKINGVTPRGCQIYIYTDYSKDRFGGGNTEDYCYTLEMDRSLREILVASQCEDQSRGDARGI